MSRILVTGAAGFIGYHVTRTLLGRGDAVVGVDDLNDYYDPALKRARLERIREAAGDGDGSGGADAFEFREMDLADRAATEALFADHRFDAVVHLAAQAGVRYSLENPHAYADSNLAALLAVLEGCRHGDVEHLVFASSSSVYGANTSTPYSVHDRTDHPVSLYAATKKSGELLAHTYAHLYGVATTCLRFFTVYGPWGRPDMAYYKFTDLIVRGETIDVYNEGKMKRGFTYVDDVVELLVRVLDRPAAPDPGWSAADPDPASSSAPFRVYNLGNPEPVGLLEFIGTLEQALGRTAEKNLMPMQPGDVVETDADVSELADDFGYAPSTPLDEGLRRFVAWYREYHGV